MMVFNRRLLMKSAGIAAIAGVGASNVSACAVAPAINLAFSASWLSNLTSTIGATVITTNAAAWWESAESFISDSWRSWQGGAVKAGEIQVDEGWKVVRSGMYGDSLPPATMFDCSRQEEPDPRTDRLVVLVNGGARSVVFDAWAWQGLAMFAHDMTSEREGDDLAAYRTLCGAALTPSGVAPHDVTSPSGRSQLLSYQARSGAVEMTRTTSADGAMQVQITTFGIPTSKGSPTVRSFTLPEETRPTI